MTTEGALVGPYRIVSELGSGGLGTVRRAVAQQERPGVPVGTEVALRVLPAQLVGPGEPSARFLRDAEQGRSVRHPAVVRVLDAGEFDTPDGPVHLLASEFVAGKTLRSLMEELGTVPEELCRRIGQSLAEGLAAVHGAGVVHCGVRPENVLLTDGQEVRILDLGLAHPAAERSRAADDPQPGPYDAPEQVGAPMESVDARADLFALGVVLYEMATGRHPFAEESPLGPARRDFDRPPRPAGERNPQVSAFFEEFLQALLAVGRERRLGPAASVARILELHERSAWWVARSRALRERTGRELRRVRIPSSTGVHGREHELARLRAQFDLASGGAGRGVVIQGEAGIGKSRLVNEFVDRLRRGGEPFRLLLGFQSPGSETSTAGAFADALRGYFGEENLEEEIGACLPSAGAAVPAFAAMLRRGPRAGAPPALPLTAFARLTADVLRAVASKSPVVVVVEDLRFSTDDGRTLLPAVTRALGTARVLLVATTGRDLPEDWAREVDRLPNTSRIELGSLGPRDLVRLLVDAFRSQRLAQDLAFEIAEKTDGNPFFVFEILRGLRESRHIVERTEGKWVSSGVLRDVAIPATASAVTQARLAELGPEDRELLDLASCAGFTFDPALVAVAAGRPVLGVLRRLARIEQLYRVVHAAGRRYVFDHILTHEALTEGLQGGLAAGCHRAIGEALESTTAAASTDPAVLDGALATALARHFVLAGNPARAARYLVAALDQLTAAYDHAAALDLAERAAAGGGIEGDLLVEVLVRRARLLAILRRAEEAERVLDEAEGLARKSSTGAVVARVLCERARHLRDMGRQRRALEIFKEARLHAAEAGDEPQVGRCHAWIGEVLLERGDLEAAAGQAESGLEIARREGLQEVEASALRQLGLVFGQQGHLDAAVEHLRASASRGVVTCDLGREAVVLRDLASAELAAGDVDGALTSARRSVEVAVYAEDPAIEAESRLVQGRALAARGDLEEALEAMCAAVAGFEGLGIVDPRRAAAHLACASLLAGRKRISQAESHCRAVLDLPDEAPMEQARLHARALLASMGLESPGTVLRDLRRLASGETPPPAVTGSLRRDVHGLLWKGTGDAAQLAEARRAVEEMLAPVSEDTRRRMRTAIPQNREILEASEGS